jgi:hypothetical protein
MSHIVAYRAPVLANDKIGREEKSPIHVADVIRISDANVRLGKEQAKKSPKGQI